MKRLLIPAMPNPWPVPGNMKETIFANERSVVDKIEITINEMDKRCGSTFYTLFQDKPRPREGVTGHVIISHPVTSPSRCPHSANICVPNRLSGYNAHAGSPADAMQ